MIRSIKRLIALFISFLLLDLVSEGQTYQYLTLDSALSINSEQFGFITKGKSDIKLAVLGPYKVGYIEKIDSGKYSTRTKLGNEISPGSRSLLEEYKVKRYEAYAYYKMKIGNDADSAACFFSYFLSYNEKKETLLSNILSQKDESATLVYSDYSSLFQGTFAVLNDQEIWRFMLDYPPSSYGRINEKIKGYLTDGRDSLRIDLVYADIIKKSKKDPSQEKLIMRSPRGYTLVDFENRQVAALIFREGSPYLAKKLGNFTNGELVIIGNDNRKSAKLAIAALFSIMISLQ